MHELLMKVTRMRLKGDILAEVLVMWSIRNEIVPSSHTCMIVYEAANTKHETYIVRAVRIIISLTDTFVYILLLFTIVDEH